MAFQCLGIMDSMKTSLDIPEKDLKEVMRYTKAKTKREAIVTAIQDYNRRQKVRDVVKMFGTFESLASNDEIEAAEMTRTRRVLD